MIERNLKGKSKLHSGITLVALVITIVILIILAVISINAVFGDNGIIAQAELAAEKTEDSKENEQKVMSEAASSIEEILNRENKPELPEVDKTTTIECVNDDKVLGENLQYFMSCKDKDTFNDDIFTVNNYKVVGIFQDENPGGHPLPLGYFADQNNRTRQLAFEFDVACQKFEIVGCGGFRLSVWDESKNRWKYVQSSTGVKEEEWAWYLVTFPNATKRTVRVEGSECFVGVAVKQEDADKVTKTTRQPGKRVLFVGNSWTNGTLGTQVKDMSPRLYNSYVNVLSDALGFECINNGVGATGYSVSGNGADENWKPIWYENRIRNMVEQGLTPDIIIIGGAGNDIFSRATEPERVAEEAQNCINEVNNLKQKTGKDIKLIMIGVEKVADDDIKEEFKANAEPMNKLLKEVALKNNIPFIDFITNTSIASDGTTITKGTTPFVLAEYIGDDSLHPTIEGHQKIGVRLAEEIQAILKYEKWFI